MGHTLADCLTIIVRTGTYGISDYLSIHVVVGVWFSLYIYTLIVVTSVFIIMK